MRLKSIYTSRYKNLMNLTLAFDGGSFIDIFFGKNGTGKSNLFDVFRPMVEFIRQKCPVDININKPNGSTVKMVLEFVQAELLCIQCGVSSEVFKLLCTGAGHGPGASTAPAAAFKPPGCQRIRKTVRVFGLWSLYFPAIFDSVLTGKKTAQRELDLRNRGVTFQVRAKKKALRIPAPRMSENPMLHPKCSAVHPIQTPEAVAPM